MATFYFDASDAGPSDPGDCWTDDSKAFDGDTSTNYAATFTQGTSSSNYLGGVGTNASGSDTISLVEARIYCGGNLVTNYADIFYGAENLGTCQHDSLPLGWSSYVELSEPSGGWDWTKLAALETIVGDNGVLINRDAYTREYRIKFVEEVVNMLQNNDYRTSLTNKALQYAKKFSWPNVAKDWQRLFRS